MKIGNGGRPTLAVSCAAPFDGCAGGLVDVVAARAAAGGDAECGRAGGGVHTVLQIGSVGNLGRSQIWWIGAIDRLVGKDFTARLSSKLGGGAVTGALLDAVVGDD